MIYNFIGDCNEIPYNFIGDCNEIPYHLPRLFSRYFVTFFMLLSFVNQRTLKITTIIQYHGNRSLRCPKAQNDKRSGIGEGGSDLPSTKNFSKTHSYKKMNSFPENGKIFLGVLPHYPISPFILTI